MNIESATYESKIGNRILDDEGIPVENPKKKTFAQDSGRNSGGGGGGGAYYQNIW